MNRLTIYVMTFVDKLPEKGLQPVGFRTHDAQGHRILGIDGITPCSPNNWCRRILYFFGAPRWMIRRV